MDLKEAIRSAERAQKCCETAKRELEAIAQVEAVVTFDLEARLHLNSASFAVAALLEKLRGTQRKERQCAVVPLAPHEHAC